MNDDSIMLVEVWNMVRQNELRYHYCKPMTSLLLYSKFPAFCDLQMNTTYIQSFHSLFTVFTYHMTCTPL
jgi:hypothetical protein